MNSGSHVPGRAPVAGRHRRLDEDDTDRFGPFFPPRTAATALAARPAAARPAAAHPAGVEVAEPAWPTGAPDGAGPGDIAWPTAAPGDGDVVGGGLFIPHQQGAARPPEPRTSPEAGARPVPAPVRPAAGVGDDEDDTGPVSVVVAVGRGDGDAGERGLRAFDLGSVPASVTPPRSWRRAAWFAIGASAAALLGLVVAMSALVGPMRPFSRITALPALPTGLPTFVPRTTDPLAPVPTHRAGPGQPDPRPSAQDGAAAPAPVQPGTPGTPGTPGPPGPLTGRAATGAPPTAVSPPAVTTVTGTAQPATDPGQLSTRTQQFFAEVTSNAQAAAQLTVGAAQEDTAAVIQRHYGDISSIQVQSIQLDPGSGVTVSLLHVTHKDGTTSTEQQKLQFTLTDDPKITNPAG
jgi:hypothetical protein